MTKSHKRSDSIVGGKQNPETGEIDYTVAEQPNQSTTSEENQHLGGDEGTSNRERIESNSSEGQQSFMALSDIPQSKGTSDSYVVYTDENVKDRSDSQIISDEGDKNIGSSSSSEPTSFGAVSELPSSYHPSVTDDNKEEESDHCTSDEESGSDINSKTSEASEDNSQVDQQSSVFFLIYMQIISYFTNIRDFIAHFLHRDTNDVYAESIEDFNLESLFGTSNDENTQEGVKEENLGGDQVVPGSITSHDQEVPTSIIDESDKDHEVSESDISDDRKVPTASEDESEEGLLIKTGPTPLILSGANVYRGAETEQLGQLVSPPEHDDQDLGILNFGIHLNNAGLCLNSLVQVNEQNVPSNGTMIDPDITPTAPAPEESDETSTDQLILQFSGLMSPADLDRLA